MFIFAQLPISERLETETTFRSPLVHSELHIHGKNTFSQPDVLQFVSQGSSVFPLNSVKVSVSKMHGNLSFFKYGAHIHR